MVPATLPEVLDFEHVRHDLLRLAITVGVHERNMAALCDHVADGREPRAEGGKRCPEWCCRLPARRRRVDCTKSPFRFGCPP